MNCLSTSEVLEAQKMCFRSKQNLPQRHYGLHFFQTYSKTSKVKPVNFNKRLNLWIFNVFKFINFYLMDDINNRYFEWEKNEKNVFDEKI